MTTLHLTQNTDRIHVVKDGYPICTMLFNFFESSSDAVKAAKARLFDESESLELKGERLKVSFVIKHD